MDTYTSQKLKHVTTNILSNSTLSFTFNMKLLFMLKMNLNIYDDDDDETDTSNQAYLQVFHHR